MTRRHDDTPTPFEETLTDLPQEEAPADLPDRCLAALDAATVTPTKKRVVPWNHFALAAAASLILALVAMPLLLSGTQAKHRVASCLSNDKQPRLPAADQHMDMPPASPMPASPAGLAAPAAPAQEPPEAILGRRHPSYQSALDKDHTKYESAAVPPPAGAPGAPGGMPTSAVNEGYGAHFGRDLSEAPPVETRAGARVAVSSKELQVAQAPPVQTMPTRPDASTATDAVVPTPGEPWYDRAEDRKKISTRDMTISTPDVEQAYRNVVSAIEKVGGYIAREDLMVQDDERDRATIAARVPAASFDAVVEQLRGLGKLVKMSGSSEDRTQEYKSRAADIRALSDAEQQMVRRIANAGTEQKRVLQAALDELRHSREKEKKALLRLAAETSFAYLNIEIIEGGHFWRSLQDKCVTALPFAMALALVALPFFVVAMVWRRRG